MNFYQLLKSKNFKQSELGSKLNLSQKVISNYCTGSREPKLRTLEKMSEILDFSIDTIVKSLLKSKERRKEDEWMHCT